MTKREQLTDEARAHLDKSEALVEWESFVSIPGEPDEGGETPFPPPCEPGPSLVDRPRRGHLIVKHAPQWRQAIVIEMSDGTQQTELMLDAVQAEYLIEGLRRWRRGILADWLEGSPDALPLTWP